MPNYPSNSPSPFNPELDGIRVHRLIEKGLLEEERRVDSRARKFNRLMDAIHYRELTREALSQPGKRGVDAAGLITVSIALQQEIDRLDFLINKKISKKSDLAAMPWYIAKPVWSKFFSKNGHCGCLPANCWNEAGSSTYCVLCFNQFGAWKDFPGTVSAATNYIWTAGRSGVAAKLFAHYVRIAAGESPAPYPTADGNAYSYAKTQVSDLAYEYPDTQPQPQTLPKVEPSTKPDLMPRQKTKGSPLPWPGYPVLDPGDLSEQTGPDTVWDGDFDKPPTVKWRIGAPSANPRPPKKPSKEKKVTVRSIAGGLWVAINSTTELFDFIDAMYRAIPKSLRPWKDLYKASDGKYHPLTPQQKLQLVWANFENIDIGQALVNYVNNQIEDAAYGLTFGQAGKKLNQLTGQVSGGGSGLNAGSDSAQDEFGYPQIPSLKWDGVSLSIGL